MGLIQDIGKGPVALDTAILIYLIEDHPTYAPLLLPLYETIEAGKLNAVTSGIALLEVLVVPLRAGNLALAQQYERVLTESRGLRLLDIDRDLLRSAAQIRATYARVRTPDALQIAAALSHGCTALLTNDRDLPEIPGLRILQLARYAGS